jgi:hypothetical protein
LLHEEFSKIFQKLTKFIEDNRDICKVRKRQHQYPEFGHTQGEILEKPAEKYISNQKGGEMVPEFHPVFLFS